MSRPGPSRRQVRRRRLVALAAIAIAAAAVWLVLAATVFAPVNKQGAQVIHLTLHSKAVGRDLGVNVVLPARPAARGDRGLLVFLHGRGGSENTSTDNDVVFSGLAKLGRRAPVMAFPDGGDHSYWHDRAEGDWGAM